MRDPKIKLLLIFLLELHLYAALALDEGQVNFIANENCAPYLVPPHGNSSRKSFTKDHDNTTVTVYDSIAEGKSMCPPWYKMTESGKCQVGYNFNDLVIFEGHTQQTWLQTFYCMTTSDVNTTNRTDVIGSCLLSFDVRLSSFYPLPCNVSELNVYMCAGLNREGQLCGRCVKGFAPPVFSYSLNCVNCTNYHLNWLKYIAVAFGPLTVFCILICVFHISATSAYLHGFVFYCQILTMPTLVRMAQNVNGYKEAGASERLGGQVYVSLLSLWNLDIFRAFYKPFCLHPNLTLMQALALDYLIALYPLVLLAIVFLLVSLHSRNVAVIVRLWKPFRIIVYPLIRNLNIETSLIQSFATLYLLSAMKVQSVTLDLLSPTALYHTDGRVHKTLYLYLTGDVKYFGKEHLPYALLALFFLSTFTIFPCLLLFLYPFCFFQRFLNNIHCNSHALRAFMDAFQGNFKDGTNGTCDFRFFSGVFFLTRFILAEIFVLLSSLYSFLIFGTVLTMLALSVAILHPQRTKIHYTLDCIVLLFLSFLLFSTIGFFLAPHNSIPSTVSKIVGYLGFFLPLLYITCLAIYWIAVRKRIPQRLGSFIMKSAARAFHRKTNEQQGLLVHAF